MARSNKINKDSKGFEDIDEFWEITDKNPSFRLIEFRELALNRLVMISMTSTTKTIRASPMKMSR